MPGETTDQCLEEEVYSCHNKIKFPFFKLKIENSIQQQVEVRFVSNKTKQNNPIIAITAYCANRINSLDLLAEDLFKNKKIIHRSNSIHFSNSILAFKIQHFKQDPLSKSCRDQ